jgi:hypothetical protein
LSDKETIEKIKKNQGVLSKIQNFLTLGYDTKEDLRELDKKLRDQYYNDLREMRRLWGDIYLEVLEKGSTVPRRGFKKVIQVLDRVMEKIRHADYGYAGLMDRKGHIRENELARILEYDKNLNSTVESMKELVNKMYGEVETENWSSIPEDVKKMKNLLLNFENELSERQNKFRPLEM